MEETPITEKTQREERLTQLADFIDNEHGLLGHGTSLLLASEIMTNGIRVNDSYHLGGIAIPLSGIPNEKLLDTLENWEHKNSKAIILISVPDIDGFRQDSEVVGTTFDLKLNRERSFIPSEFIRGYYDAEKGIFVKNLKWQ